MNALLTKSQLTTAQANYHPNPEQSHSLHKNCYLDPAYLKAEQQQIFNKTWQFVCHEEKLRKPKSYVTTTVQGQSILILRTSDNELKAYYNVCKHRAHELLRGEGQTNTITCPYHAWSYSLEGNLVNARHAEHLKDFDKSKICLDPVKVETFCHFIFINLDPNATPLIEQTENLATEINHYAPDLKNLTHVKQLTYKINANWKATIDNFLECCHCPIAHQGFCSIIDMDSYRVKCHNLYSSHMAKAIQDPKNNNAYNIKDANVTDHAVWFLWPNTALLRYPGNGNFMVWRFYPETATTATETFDFYYGQSTPSEDELESINFIHNTLQPEDIALVESVQRGMTTPAYQQGRYLIDPQGSGLSEHAVHHFHGLIIQAYHQTQKHLK